MTEQNNTPEEVVTPTDDVSEIAQQIVEASDTLEDMPSVDLDEDISGGLESEDSTKQAAQAEEIENDMSSAEDVVYNREPKAIQKYPTSSSRDKAGNPDELSIPPKTRKEIDSRLDAAPNIDLVASAKQNIWASALLSSFNNMPMRGFYTDRLDKDNSSFSQDVEYNGNSLRGGAPTINSKRGVIETEGSRAILEMVTHLGVGGLFYAPMWHSGFWVMFRPASEDEQIDLNNAIAAMRINYMRQSYGLPLSSSGVYALDTVFQFALDHVYHTSVNSNEMPISDIRDHLAPQDIWSFIWGFLCANYPTGFFYSTACINHPNGCNYVAEETLNLTRLQWTDDSVLTDWQRSHMANRKPQTMKLESVKRYQEECISMKPKRVVILEGERGVAMTFKPCTLTEYINESTTYVGDVVDAVNAALTQESDEDRRNNLVNTKIRSSYLAQYSHWVESIEFGDFSETDDPDSASIRIVKDRISVSNQLRTLSAIDSIREKTLDAMKEYISDTTFSIIGTNSFDCPECDTVNEDTNYPRMTSVIPLDMFEVFFNLLTQRLSRIEAR